MDVGGFDLTATGRSIMDQARGGGNVCLFRHLLLFVLLGFLLSMFVVLCVFFVMVRSFYGYFLFLVFQYLIERGVGGMQLCLSVTQQILLQVVAQRE